MPGTGDTVVTQEDTVPALTELEVSGTGARWATCWVRGR